MKKNFMKVLAALAVVSLSSCGGNAETETTDVDSTAQTEEVAAEEEATPEEEKKEELEAGPVTLDFQNLKVDIPEGWVIKNKTDGGYSNITIAPANEEELRKEISTNFGFDLQITSFSFESASAEKKSEEAANQFGEGKAKKSTKTIAGIKYNVFHLDEGHGSYDRLIAPLKGGVGCVDIKVSTKGLDDPDVKKVLESIVLKK